MKRGLTTFWSFEKEATKRADVGVLNRRTTQASPLAMIATLRAARTGTHAPSECHANPEGTPPRRTSQALLWDGVDRISGVDGRGRRLTAGLQILQTNAYVALAPPSTSRCVQFGQIGFL